MAEAETVETPAAKRSSKPVLIGAALALILGGGGFFAAYSGLISLPLEGGKTEIAPLPAIAFVPVPPMVVSLGAGATRHLRFASELEVEPATAIEVTALLPRILDVLNGYLRAVDLAELEDPAALVRVRAQLLRRIQVVTGEGRVRDLLITEFVLN